MPYSINGIGTMYYGEADRRPDGTFVTTEWVVFSFIPLIPLRSFRLARNKKNDVHSAVHSSESYSIHEQLGIYWPQVFRIYGFVIGSISWWVGTLAMMEWLNVFKNDRPIQYFYMVLVPLMLVFPFLTMWWVRRRNYRLRYGDEPKSTPNK